MESLHLMLYKVIKKRLVGLLNNNIIWHTVEAITSKLTTAYFNIDKSPTTARHRL